MAAIRTIEISPLSGSRPKRCDPQAPQKVFESPPGGVQSRRRSSPVPMVSDPGSTLAEACTAVPVRF